MLCDYRHISKSGKSRISFATDICTAFNIRIARPNISPQCGTLSIGRQQRSASASRTSYLRAHSTKSNMILVSSFERLLLLHMVIVVYVASGR